VLYECIREGRELRVFEKRVLRRILGPKRGEVTGGWRKPHNKELHNLYSSPDIIIMRKSMRMKWEGRVARKGRRGMHAGFWPKSQKERNNWEDLDVGGWIILSRVGGYA
jgi:hypothetical protein